MALTDDEQTEILDAVRASKEDTAKIRQWTNETTGILLGTDKRAGMFWRRVAAAVKKA